MGAVFKVRHRLLNEFRVIKIIRPAIATDERLQTRFLGEARAASKLKHPNVAQVHDFAIDPEGIPYIVMEYIDGLSWRDLINRHGGLPVSLAIEMTSQCLRALEYLHQRGFVHRDISPDNIMLSRDVEGRPWVKLIDLGLAKRLTGDLGLTESGWFVGKMRYASPEQFGGSASDVGPRSDLYSLGVVLFELLTGACPIQGDTPESIVGSHLKQTRDFPETTKGRGVPLPLRQLVMSTLEVDPDNRPQTASELRRHLQPFLTGDLPDLEEFLPSGNEDTTLALPTSSWGLSGPEWLAPAPNDPSGQSGARSTGNWRWRLGLVAAVAVLTLLLTWLWQRGPEESLQSATGIAAIDAAPWAVLTQVMDEQGQVVPQSEPTDTPALLHLPPGRYSLRLRHPELPEERQVDIEVLANETVRSNVDLGLIDLDRYFEDVGLADYLRDAGSE